MIQSSGRGRVLERVLFLLLLCALRQTGFDEDAGDALDLLMTPFVALVVGALTYGLGVDTWRESLSVQL